MTIKNFARSLLILVTAVFAPLGVAHADPNQGPGGPILVITNGNQNFGKFYAEILRTEGFNEFAVADIGSVTSTTLTSYDVVILAKIAVTSTQATMLSDWVTAGGNLVAMDPAPQLASLLGITSGATTLSNGYLLVNTSTKVGSGIPATDPAVPRHRAAFDAGRCAVSRHAVLECDHRDGALRRSRCAASARMAARPRHSCTTSRRRSSIRAREIRPGPASSVTARLRAAPTTCSSEPPPAIRSPTGSTRTRSRFRRPTSSSAFSPISSRT